ncbi:MAG: hypothetical protein E7652_06350 [Ruminococcaceae bacterium]|nr:hypothetical protein [Oscillospiraceae bacterium]
MRLQLPKNADPENLHKYWFFGPRYSYTVAAEQKARTTYDNILKLVDNPDVIEPIKFLRQREIVHFQRFGEALEMVKDDLDPRNYYYYNPSYPNGCK